jgi:hypothetical protein
MEWISVKDKLPDETHEEVLIYPYVGVDNCVITAHLDGDKNWRYWDISKNNMNLPCAPTHWMPLPPPPSIQPSKEIMCEECDLPMHEFATNEGESGYSCDGCGWSIDNAKPSIQLEDAKESA